MKTLAEIIQSHKPVQVDFPAKWCCPCQMMVAVFNDLKKYLKEDVAILKIDLDKNVHAPQPCNVQRVATLIILQKG